MPIGRGVSHVFDRDHHDFTETTFTGSLLYRSAPDKGAHFIAGGGVGLQWARTHVDEPPFRIDRTETIRLLHGRIGGEWDLSSRVAIRTEGVLWFGEGLDWVLGLGPASAIASEFASLATPPCPHSDLFDAISNRGNRNVRILFITSAHNSLSQRLQVELADRGHAVAIHLATSDEAMGREVDTQQPDLIVAPMLTKAIPRAIWQRHLCLIVHPGIKGDRGPSSLDWAIALGEPSWGVTILQAVGGDGCRADLGRGGVSAADEARHQERHVSRRRDRGRRGRSAGGGRAVRARRVRAGGPRLPPSRCPGHAEAGDETGPTAPSTGRATRRRGSSGGSAQPTAVPACSMRRCAARRSTCTVRTKRTACAACPASSSRSAREPSASARWMPRSGSAT